MGRVEIEKQTRIRSRGALHVQLRKFRLHLEVPGEGQSSKYQENNLLCVSENLFLLQNEKIK